MRAIQYTRYGPPEVLRMGEVEKPEPGDAQVLVRVITTSVTTGDTRLRGLNVPRGLRLVTRLAFGVTKPRETIPGMEFAGIVESAGVEVTEFEVGDLVFGTVHSGACAEYVRVDEDGDIATKPVNLSFREAAAIPFGALTSLVYLRDFGSIKSGHRVLVNGASGSLGTYAIQLAKYYGAEVTGVCSTSNIDMVQSLGADNVIDYTQQDFTRSRKKYDIIFDTVGKVTYSMAKDSLVPDGKLLLAVAGVPQFLQVLWHAIRGGKRVVAGVAVFEKEDLRFIKQLVEAGKIYPVIDRIYEMEEAAAAHRYVERGHKKGNVVLSVSHAPDDRRVA